MKTKKLRELEQNQIIFARHLRGEIVRAEETSNGLILVFSDSRFAHITAEPDYEYTELALHRFPDLYELRDAGLITPEDIEEQRRLEKKEWKNKAERRKAAELERAIEIIRKHGGEIDENR